jgi:hypothetical protein
MPKFEKCGADVRTMANEILCAFETHQPLLDARVTVDYVFAYADEDDNGNKRGHALSHGGVRALGIARKIPLKDRVLGRADAEISLDGDWWNEAPEKDKRALLDHELHHLSIKIDKRGLVRDDSGRPCIYMRKHDFEFGWFRIIAERHGLHSIECQQAKLMMDNSGQLFWPELITK